MNALDELIENAKTAHEALEPHYSIKNNGTGINYAYNLLPLFKTEEAAAELAALRQERDAARAVVEAAREYVDLNLSDEYCPNCLHRISDGHDNGCELAELAAALEVTK